MRIMKVHGRADEPVGPDDSLNAWLVSRSPAPGLTRKAAAVVDVLTTRPELSSYSGVAEVARLAGANVATVTRTAQVLGFSGWPALQQELRARYLSSLSATQVAAEHGKFSAEPAAASIRRDQDGLSRLALTLDESTIKAMAVAVAGSRQTLIMASGSYAAAGLFLAHNVGLTGYQAQLHRDISADFANALAACGPGDVLVAITFWRIYTSAVQAVQLAKSHGLTVCVITDTGTSQLTPDADHVLVVPAEGVSFAPSLTPAIAVVQAICAELAALDPARTDRTVAQADKVWREAGLLSKGPR
jgi:DNA-binding MurR/RpiR family transcriptional regulator